MNETEEEDVCSPFPKRRILSSEDAFPEIELDGGTESLNSSISSDLPMKKLKKKEPYLLFPISPASVKEKLTPVSANQTRTRM